LPGPAGSAGGSKGKAPFGAFPVPVLVTLLTSALAALGIAGGLLTEPLTPDTGLPSWVTVASFVVLLTAAGFSTVEIQFRDQGDALDLFEAVLAPAIFLLPPLTVVIVAGLGKALSESLQRIQPTKACFNVAQWMSAAAAGSFVFHLQRPDDTVGPGNLWALIVAMVAVSVVNLIALTSVLLITRQQPLKPVLADLAPAIVRGSVIGWTVNVAFGVIFAATAVWVPQAILLWLVPLAVLYWANRAYASVRADRFRLAGMQRATHALAVPMNPRDAVPEFLAGSGAASSRRSRSWSSCSRAAGWSTAAASRSRAASSGSRRPAARPWPRP
jgi:hypothetical protein